MSSDRLEKQLLPITKPALARVCVLGTFLGKSCPSCPGFALQGRRPPRSRNERTQLGSGAARLWSGTSNMAGQPFRLYPKWPSLSTHGARRSALRRPPQRCRQVGKAEDLRWNIDRDNAEVRLNVPPNSTFRLRAGPAYRCTSACAPSHAVTGKSSTCNDRP